MGGEFDRGLDWVRDCESERLISFFAFAAWSLGFLRWLDTFYILLGLDGVLFGRGRGGGVMGRMGSPPKEERPSFTMKCFSIYTVGLLFFYVLVLGYTLGDGYHSVQFWSNTTSERKTYEAAAQRGSALSLLIRTFGFHALEHRMSRCWLAEERETG